MQNTEKYGPQTQKIGDLFEALTNTKLTNLWSGARFDHSKHYTDRDWAALTLAKNCAYDVAVKSGRKDAWTRVYKNVRTLGTGKFCRTGQMDTLLALVVSDLIGSDFTQEQLDLLLGIYYKFWPLVGKLFEETQPNSPERQIAIDLFTNTTNSEEALVTAKRALTS